MIPVRKVKLGTETIGVNFATCGVIRDAATGRKLHETMQRPFGFKGSALADAIAVAEARGWQIMGVES